MHLMSSDFVYILSIEDFLSLVTGDILEFIV